ncbi:Alpha/Beta hydrolase protein [Lentinula edodes]|uniref:Alpha/Beta hydrolase protein n=1 Tax=Lentinula edodes TaxID=5353 RepID=UPI001E8D17B5|nr:Alpha/Beta hydrolase protein [Lentinula edodes]KAH7872307.1 Alpha/Beta hydrolase protein [Lentinula edodes]
MSVELPFQISIPDSKLDLLRQKLALTEFPDELENTGWNYGAPLSDIKRLVARWKDVYDWKLEEAKLNQDLPQFTKDILVNGFETLNIHYVHQKSSLANAIPLLFVHGWPGSFIEVRKILPLLVQSSPQFPAFHVVALSLPGFGFSEGAHKPGFAPEQYAEVAHKLMLSLGYHEYVTQGGDWGYLITRIIAHKYGGKHSKAWHTNFPLATPLNFSVNPILFLQHLFTPYTAAEKAGIERSKRFEKEGQGYFHEQSTKPQTLGYSLADSPVGLLAWIYEKLATWTDSYPWTDDEVLTWVTIFYFSRAGPAASIRIYYEFIHSANGSQPSSFKPTIPLGVSHFPEELRITPRKFVHSVGNLVFQVEHSTGGHFAAYECPDELVDDLREMFGKQGPAFGVVPGKTGYEQRIRANL